MERVLLLQNCWRGKLASSPGDLHFANLCRDPGLAKFQKIQHRQRRRQGNQEIARWQGAGLTNRVDSPARSTGPRGEGRSRYGPELQRFAQRVATCNEGRGRRSEFFPFTVGNDVLGYVHQRFAEHLKKYSDVFSWHEPGSEISARANYSIQGAPSIALVPRLSSPEARTAAVQEVLQDLRKEGRIPGWRDELYPVTLGWGKSPTFLMERAAAPLFGLKAYEVYVNGYATIDGEKHFWVARRSATKETYPRKLDHLVAGGQPHGISAKDNVVKECEEEAGIPVYLAENAVAAGVVSYEEIDGLTMKRDVLFCYDLELPEEFEPFNRDGEVQSFSRVPVPEVMEIVRNTEEYMPSCALVIIDFLIRHGYITPEQSGYLALLGSLRIGEL